MTLKEEQTNELSIAQITQLMANGMGNMLHKLFITTLAAGTMAS